MNSKFCTWRRINMIKNFGRKFSIIKFSLSIIINIKNSAFIKKNKKLTANFQRSSINSAFRWEISYIKIGLEKTHKKQKLKIDIRKESELRSQKLQTKKKENTKETKQKETFNKKK
jgi:hypothetical protein